MRFYITLGDIVAFLRFLLSRIHLRLKPATTFLFDATFDNPPRFLKGVKMLLLTDVQKVVLSIRPVDAAGNPAPVDGVPTWSVSDPTLLSVSPAGDGMSAVVTANGPLGSAQVSVSADADMGAGVVLISGTLDVTVSASQAVSLSISSGAPEAK